MAMAEGVGKFRENKKLDFFFWDFSWSYFFLRELVSGRFSTNPV